MGECEALYRISPELHLSHSNVKCLFVATGFPVNRSKFLVRVKDENNFIQKDDEDQEEPDINSNQIEIPGKEGKFKETTSIHQKYSNRPEYLENMCLAQFSMMYESIPPQSVKKIKFIDGISGLS